MKIFCSSGYYVPPAIFCLRHDAVGQYVAANHVIISSSVIALSPANKHAALSDAQSGGRTDFGRWPSGRAVPPGFCVEPGLMERLARGAAGGAAGGGCCCCCRGAAGASVVYAICLESQSDSLTHV